MARAGVVRRTLLRPRRHGESYQGTTDVVLGSHQHALSAEQSAAPVFLLGCLRAVADVAATGTGGDGVGQGAVLQHSAQGVEDRRADPHHGAQGVGLAGEWISLRHAIPASLRKAVRYAAKVLKKKDPGQLFSGLCRPMVRCAPKPYRREKNSHAERKTDKLHHNTWRNYLATPNSNKLHTRSAKLTEMMTINPTFTI